MTDDLIERFESFAIVELGLAPTTMSAYHADLAAYLVFIRDMGISPESASVDILSSYLQGLTKAGYAITSILRFMATLKTFYAFLRERGVIQVNPVELLDLPKPTQTVPDVLSQDMMATLFVGADETDRYAVRDRAMLELFYASGIRVSELIGLHVDDWYPRLGVLKVNGKGSKERIVPVHNVAAKALADYIAGQRRRLVEVECIKVKHPTDIMFLSRAGRPLSRVAVWQIIRRLAAHAGIRPVHPHTLRHSFASHMLSGGADLRVIQEILGHADVQTTQRYTHVDLEHLRRIHKLHPRQ